ncbi:transcriptional regulator [Thiolapillus sp.]
MDINGPLKIGVIDSPDTPGWELQIKFTDDFKSASLENQGKIFQAYIQELVDNINNLPEGDRNRDGMAIVYQFCSQMLPYIKDGQIALEETMTVEIGQSQAISITDFLNG